MSTECPRCRRNTVETLATSTKCSTCGWEGPRCFGAMWEKTDPKCAGGADPTYWVGSTHVRPKCSYESECQLSMSKNKEDQVIPAQSIVNKPWQNVEVRSATATPPKQLMPPVTVASQPAMPTMNAATARPIMNPPAGMNVQVRQQTVQVAPAQQQQARMMQQPAQVVTQQYRQVQQMGQVPQPPTPLHQQVQHMQQMQQAQPQVHMPVAGSPMAWVPPQSAAMPAYVPQNYPAPGSQMPGYLTVPESANNGLAPMFFNSCMRAALKGAFHTAANLMDHVPWG